MNAVQIIARKEFRAAFRSRLFITIAALFLAMSILSVYIGSATRRTEMRVYNETVALLTAQGATSLPPRPEIHTLTILSNLTEYVGTVGAILAVVLGYNTLIEEKASGGLRLILSRPVYRDQLLTGKLLGSAAVIGTLLGLAFVFNLVLLVLVGGIWPTPGEVLRLLSLVGLAFFYMLIFLAFSMLLSIRMKDSATVFLLSLLAWMLVSFVIPQMADTTMSNSTVINSISGATNQIPQDTAVSRAINALSPTWYLRSMGRQLLEVVPDSQTSSAGALVGRWFGALLALLVPSIVSVAAGYATFLRDETLTIENGL